MIQNLNSVQLATIIQSMNKARLEALSDGVFAVAITLLILNVKLPHEVASNHALWSMLRQIAPNIAAYVLSFCIIAIFWNGHHTILSLAKKVDRPLIWMNLLYLMLVAFMPFPTSLLATYHHYQAAVILYSSVLVCIGLLHFILLSYIYYHPQVAQMHFTPGFLRRSRVASLFGAGCGLAATIMSFISLEASLVLLVLVPIYYIFINRTKDELADR
jgi:uncharacterized membrane protein